jgi:hypothetical protein
MKSFRIRPMAKWTFRFIDIRVSIIIINQLSTIKKHACNVSYCIITRRMPLVTTTAALLKSIISTASFEVITSSSGQNTCNVWRHIKFLLTFKITRLLCINVTWLKSEIDSLNINIKSTGRKKFEVSTAVKIQIQVFCVVTPCNAVVGYQRFRGPCRFHVQGDNGGSLDLWNVVIQPQHYTASQHRRNRP